MSDKGFITPFDTGLTTDSSYSNWVKVRHHGNEERCSELEIKARGLLQKLIDDSKRLGLSHEVNHRRHTQADGSLIIVSYNYENPIIDIFAPSGKGKEPKASLFQCDLYQDHADTPEDLTTQTITPIYFNVVDIPYWKEIPERQGNMEWKGDFGLVSFDCVQNWGRGILNKRAWNDALTGPNGETVGWPYDRPVHASRAGEISTIVDNYPDSNIGLSETALYQLNYKAIFEPNQELVQKQFLFIEGTKYSPDFPFSNQLIMGSCVHVDEYDGTALCVLVTQAFFPDAPWAGISPEYEDVWYFNLADGINAIPIKILTMYYSSPEGDVYETSKAHITPWTFNADGTVGKALRSEQYFIKEFFTAYGPWNMHRFIDLELSYVGTTVTAKFTVDSSVKPGLVDTVIPGGSTLTYQESLDLIAYYWDWVNETNLQFKFPENEEAPYQVLDYTWHEDGFFAFGSSMKLATLVDDHAVSQPVEKRTKLCNGSKEIWSHESTGLITRTLFGPETTKKETNISYGNVAMHYVGGDARHSIAFFIRVSIEKFDETNKADVSVDKCVKQYINPNESTVDMPKNISVQLVCIFKGVETKIGSPILFKSPFITDEEPANTGHSIPPSYDNDAISMSSGPRSSYQLNVNGQRSYSSFESTISNYGDILVGDLGGSIKIAPDGTHCVVSCSYMDIAKYIYPWNRFILDSNTTTIVNRTDDMDKLGVSTELQEAWNKYMINYAIIGSEDTDGETSTRVEQMSRLLFNKKVTEDLIGGPSDNHSDYEFGIKEKDTNAFLPIGIYAFPSNEE